MLFKKFIPLTAIIAAFAGCSENGKEDIANGTGSNAGETELASITFSQENGKPLARIVARTWTMNDKGMNLASADTLDEQGKLYIDSSIGGLRLVEARSGDSLSAMSWINFDHTQTQTTLVASPSTSLKGYVKDDGKPLENATVRILDKKVLADSQGHFEIGGISEGIHFAVVEKDDRSSVYQLQASQDTSSDGSENGIDISAPAFILIDDFEQQETRRTILGRTFGEGWWYICTDSTLGGGSRTLSEPGQESPYEQDSDKGYVMHLRFDLDETTDGHFGVAGFTLGDDFENHDNLAFFDLSQATAISFEAKGAGQLFLQLVVRGQDGEKIFVKSVPTELTGEWQLYSVSAEGLATDLTAVNAINFMVENDTEFYLDNIKIEGISPGMWPELGRIF